MGASKIQQQKKQKNDPAWKQQLALSRSAAFTVSSLDEHSNLGKDHVRKFPAIRVAEDACSRNRTLIFGADQCRAIRAGISTHCRSRRHALQGRVGGLEGNYPQSPGTSFETDDKKERHPADRERYRLLFDILGQNTGASL